MKSDINGSSLPPLIANVLHDPLTHIDNLFADTWKQLRFGSLIHKAGFWKHSCTDIVDVVFLFLVRKWINVSSISMFAHKAIGLFSHARNDVLYDTLKRDDINWREFNLQAAKNVYDEHKLDKSRTRALILDDSIQARRGKKIEAVSSHFDHVSNTYVMGQQALTLGLASEGAFLPPDSQIYVSASQPHPLIKPYKDGRGVGAKRYQEAIGQSNVEMAEGMIRRAVRAVFGRTTWQPMPGSGTRR